ncbi:MAG: hypothetical protein HY670_09430 [Chloroflexi bacterium]|nr:hypothetical protein [Chloroflexota bacterium]
MTTLRKVLGWKYFYLVFYAALALIIMDGLLLPGYVFSLDMAWRTHFHIGESLYGLKESFTQIRSGLPFLFVETILNFTMPAWIIQKIVLFAVIYVSGISAHKLCPAGQVGKYFAGLLYMVNPFLYARVLVGQFALLLSYAVIPLAVLLFIRFLDTPGIRRAVLLVLGTALVAVFNIQVLIMTLLVYLVLFIFKVASVFKKPELSSLFKFTLLGGIGFFLLSFYWLLPALTAGTSPVAGISASDVPVFAPRPVSGFNTAFSVASLHGFWREGYIYAKDIIPMWQVFFLVILFLGVYGLVTGFRSSHSKAFATIWLVALFLATGASGPFASAFNYLFDHVPLFSGFRDSQKFVALLVLAYAYLGGMGLTQLKNSFGDLRKLRAKIAPVSLVTLALITPIVYALPLFGGFWGQLRPVDYPRDWYAVNDTLNQDKEDFKVLFFPWHWYMDFKWVPNKDKRTDNPAASFFDKSVIRGENIEVPGIPTQSGDPVQHYISFLLDKRKDMDNFGELVAPLNVKYIILAKEVDYKEYSFLFDQKDLELVKETENLYLLRNKHPTAKLYEVDQLSVVKDWDELLDISQQQDINDAVYLIGEPSSLSMVPSESHQLPYTRVTPGKYVLEAEPSKRYVIFTEPYNASWRLDGAEPLKNMGVTNVFNTRSVTGKVIVYKRFAVHVTGYVVSILALAGLVFCLRRR